MTKLDFEMKVKRVLREKGMTISELANKLNISNGYCSEIIRGSRVAKEKRKELKKILGV